MSNDKLTILNYENCDVRTINIDAVIFFAAKDVCDILDIKNVSQALQSLDDDEKGICKIYTLGGYQDLWMINKSGIYQLIFRSNKQEAKQFKRWLTHEVLPQLEKTGTYAIEKLSKKELALMVIESEEEKEKLQLQISHDKPKVEFVDTFINSTTTITYTDAAGILGIRRQILMDFLRDNNYIRKDRLPFAEYGKQGKNWFNTTSHNFDSASTGQTKVSLNGRFTTLGLYKISKRLLNDGIIDESAHLTVIEALKSMIESSK